MAKDNPAGGVAVVAFASVAVCVLWALLTGALWPLLPVALALGVGTLAVKAAHSKTKGRRD